MFGLFRRKKKSDVNDGWKAKMESIQAKESIARKILGEERRIEERRFEGHDRRLRTA